MTHARRAFETFLMVGIVGAVSVGPALAQPPQPPQTPRGSGAAAGQSQAMSVSQASAETYREMEVDPGVFYATVMDRPEVRIGHVRVLPGGARRTHTHDDVTFHLMVPLNGSVRLTVGSDAPIDARAGQAYFMKVGTPHSFTNTTAAEVDLIEVFVKPAPKMAAGLGEPGAPGEVRWAEALALALTAAGEAQH